MDGRELSIYEYFIKRGSEVHPSMKYNGGDVKKWQSSLRSKIIDLLGTPYKPVDLNPSTVWATEEDGLVKEKVIFDADDYSSIPAIIVKRADLDPNVQHRAVLCIHGHGPFGKDSVTGIITSQRHLEVIRQYNYDYAVQLARAGYVAIAPDLRNFGERTGQEIYSGRDSCNVHFIRGLLMGYNLISLHIWDLMRTIDYLTLRPDVDSERIGCMGLPLGGTLTMHLAALDSRIRAAVISCALTTYQEYAIIKTNFCGSQFIPGIYKYADLADIAGLIAPRPVLIEAGVYDDGFPIGATTQAYNELQEIYRFVGASGNLHKDFFEGGHEFSGRKTIKFFDSYL
ncbi:alpha/beta hydrolase family protein [Alicyclobacillus fastidiosus]|uniref:Alpha/beta hydrolase family protein n=1 Tax=Alicyclobacillus fastidiosus TaxID=392011 RepID=A0ABY6ZPH4_9BACL|nr:alpha/beta hydrolase family protein [Alicyclobacillus fastidiosus]WAH43976.1 alpha/beta hydrolase family protein [Alicyclobacillus fastidiosus]GMA60243.1 hypothetical protein GCM10025859_06830 [Alicyclobacillus fastidiosus]